MPAEVVVVRAGVRTAWRVEPADDDLLTLLQRHGAALGAGCGGAGICGACVVRVLEGEIPVPDAVERTLLGPARLAAGERLACRLPPEGGLVVALPAAHAGGARHKGDLVPAAPSHDPPLRRRRLTLAPPTLDDPTPDLERLLRHAGAAGHRLPLADLRRLPATLRRAAWTVDVLEAAARPGETGPTLLAVADPLLDASRGDGTGSVAAGRGPWAMAVDLGTTTIAAYLLDLGSGRAVDVLAAPNRQAELGADVLSRIAHAWARGVAELQRRVSQQLNELAAALAARHGLARGDLLDVTVVGNTTMLHGLLGLDPVAIGEAPFVPTAVGAMACPAAEVGLELHPAARVRTVPAVAAYLGADTVAAVLATGLDAPGGPALLVDLGTNGEIVLRHGGGLLGCSTAAGPAFEGGRVRCGVAGVDGAVAGFTWPATSPMPAVTTIADAPAAGLCGAGLLAVVAALLDLGIVDEGGRLLATEELPDDVPAAARPRCVRLDGRPAFVVVPAEATADGAPIVLTDRDVRELQLAKAAVAAGIATLLAAAHVAPEAVGRVILTGGFGAYLDPAAAVRVGLLPAALGRAAEVVGNAAGLGAVMAATSVAHAERCAAIAARVSVVELSGSGAFAEAFVDRMGFEAP
jgi:uncharacterized 2Fe-2S/4Fe-4S cluster protein (DUF4445 family)